MERILILLGILLSTFAPMTAVVALVIALLFREKNKFEEKRTTRGKELYGYIS